MMILRDGSSHGLVSIKCIQDSDQALFLSNCNRKKANFKKEIQIHIQQSQVKKNQKIWALVPTTNTQLREFSYNFLS